MIVWGASYISVHLEFLYLRLVHTELLAIWELQFRFSYLVTDSWVGYLGVSAQVSCISFYLPVCLSSFQGKWFSL